VKTIVLSAPPGGLNSYLAQPLVFRSNPHADAIFKYRFHVAATLARKSFKPEHFSQAALQDENVRVLAEKIVFEPLQDKDADLLSTSLKVILHDGRQFEVFTPFPKGEPKNNPMSTDEIIDKYRENVAYSGKVSRDDGEKAAEMLLVLEEIDDLNEIIQLLVP
jgi:2-methylcitrate dehydratase PrpD